MNPPPDSTLADPQRIIADLERANVDLQRKLERHTAERDEALARESAVTEVLQFISASPGDVGPVFQAILRRGTQLCDARFGLLGLYDGDGFRGVAAVGFPPEAAEALSRLRHPPPDTTLHRALETKKPAQVADILVEAAFAPVLIANPSLREARSNLSVPMIKDGAFVGALIMFREVVQPFDDREIALLQNFAAQAVIAMENARLLADLRERTGDLQQSLEYQTATSDVLKVISRSTFDLQPVLDTLVETAAGLCDADGSGIALRDGDVFRYAAVHAVYGIDEYSAFLRQQTFGPGRGTTIGRVALEGDVVHIADIAADPDYALTQSSTVGKIRTNLGVPLLREGAVIGMLTLFRQHVEPFTDRQIELVRTFADQAVIAIENARLIAETREALEQQTATAEVLGVINASPGDLSPVFDAMLEKAMRLCDAAFGQLDVYEDGDFNTVASRGMPAAWAEYRRDNPPRYGPGTQPARLLGGERLIHVVDLKAEEAYANGEPNRRSLVDLGGARSSLMVPLLRDNAVIGFISFYRQEVRPFTDKQIALLQNFAAQAVIAMENARLLDDLRTRTDDLQQSLEYQTATSDVLKVMSRSTFDLQPVLDTLAETAARLCDAGYGAIFRRDGEVYRVATVFAFSPDTTEAAHKFQTYLEHHPLTVDRGSVTGRTVLAGHAVQVADTASDPEYTINEATSLGKLRTQLGVPLLREGEPIGVIVVARQRVEPFTERQIELVRTFAAQAVIAIENTRLITETQEALEQQTATAEVLGVINSSPGDLAPVFQSILEKAHGLCDVAYGSLQLYDGEKFRAVAVHGLPEPLADLLRQGYSPGAPMRGLLAGEAFDHILDMAEVDDPMARNVVELSGLRTLLRVALRKDDVLLGQIVAARTEVRPFSDKQIALLQNFAAQAVIAMENARLITETREALEQQTATAEVLQVINASPGNLKPVFDALLEKATALCEAAFGILWICDGQQFQAAGLHNTPPAYAEAVRTPIRPLSTNPLHRMLCGERLIVSVDVADEEPYRTGDPARRALVDLAGARSVAQVALVKDDTLIGSLTVYRQEVRPFSDKQIALVQNFAAQAVIATENARLINETREALKQQTATAEVLGVINASPGDLSPVFAVILEKTLQLCEATFGSFMTSDGNTLNFVAAAGHPEFEAWTRRAGPTPIAGTTLERLLDGEEVVHIPDVADTEAYQAGVPARRALVDIGGFRTLLNLPLTKDDKVLGILGVYRQEVRPFSDKQIALLQNFAAQAVVAMENARLITETREALEQQTATAEILGVISSSGTDVKPVFDAIVEHTIKLCDAEFTAVARYEDDGLLGLVATNNLSSEEAAWTCPALVERDWLIWRPFFRTEPGL